MNLNLIEKSFIALIATLVITIIVMWEVPKDSDDLQAECRKESVLQTGLLACHKMEQCSLSDAEIFDLYRAGKAMVMACAKWTVVRSFEIQEELRRQVEEDAEELQRKMDEEIDIPEPLPNAPELHDTDKDVVADAVI